MHVGELLKKVWGGRVLLPHPHPLASMEPRRLSGVLDCIL